MNTLGGNMGLTLNYDTPNKAKKGILGEYWNVPVNYTLGQGVPKDALGNEKPADRKQREQKIDFDWGEGAPMGGINSNH
jgi:hypothetical protein